MLHFFPVKSKKTGNRQGNRKQDDKNEQGVIKRSIGNIAVKRRYQGAGGIRNRKDKNKSYEKKKKNIFKNPAHIF